MADRRDKTLILTFLIGAAPALLFNPRPLTAQNSDPHQLRATLRGWEEQAWLTIIDRSGSAFGRTSDRGILQRFNGRADSEYPLDLISSSVTLSEEYAWYRRSNGARFWTGSINHLRLVQEAELKANVGLGRGWAFAPHVTIQETMEADRALLRLALRREDLLEDVDGQLLATLRAEKPEADAELGFSWRTGVGSVTAALAALDLFSDLVYQSLGVNPNLADTALDYTAHPFVGRLAIDLALARRWRIEAYTAVMTATELTVESQTRPGEGFRQAERYGYAGTLLEWSATPRTNVGAFGTWVRARVERSPLEAGLPEDAFDLEERSWQLGAYALRRLGRRLSSEAWLARVWRSEDRLRPDTEVAPNVDYEDRTWAGRFDLVYRGRRGLYGGLGLEFMDRQIRGTDRLPGAFAAGHSRLRFDLGWHSADRVLIMVGTNLDLDGDGRSPNFDGGHGRFAFYW